MTWAPILDGELAVRACAAIDEICAGLAGTRVDEVMWTPDPASSLISGASLYAGAAGVALLHAYAGRPDDAVAYLSAAIDAISEPMGDSLAGGWTGVAFAVEHLQGRMLERGPDDPNTSIDDLLLERLAAAPWPGKLDLMYGVVGAGVYALERLAAAPAFAEHCLEMVVDHLADHAECDGVSGAGVTWFTPGHMIDRPAAAPLPAGRYYLGVAHGVPAMISLLTRACAVGIAVDRARPLLDGAVRWLLGQRTSGLSPRFPYWVIPDGPAAPRRMAWCYGDLGIAVILLDAARQAGEPVWERAAIELARGAAAYHADGPERARDVVDASFCHGAAGLGHLFNRLAQTTGDAHLLAAARRWFARTLDLHRPGEGCCGWRFWFPVSHLGWAAPPGLLEGAAGIGLALLAATGSLEPEWDRALAVST
ncbi:MAG TPA: lanthionine synthetase C family protein [Thermoanaerobaculia bacterium]|nr:lanthionine synthetase C family protein [Thermoanaerobaculia bacterium]